MNKSAFNSSISPLLYPSVVASCGQKYNDAYVLVETNGIGQQVSDIQHNDMDYGVPVLHVDSNFLGEVEVKVASP